MNLGRGIFELVTDSSKFDKGIDDAQKKVGSLGVVAGVVGGVSIGGLTAAMGELGRAAAAEEANIARLSASLSAAGLSYEELGDSIERKISAQTASYAFADDKQRDSLTRLIAVTKNTAQAFRLQALAMDLARFKGIDLVTATEAIVGVTQGRYRALLALGIALDENITAEEALGRVQAVVAGQAEAYGKTTQASIERTTIAIDNLKESLGGSVNTFASFATIYSGFGKLPIVTGIFGGIAAAAGTATGRVKLLSLALRAIPFVAVATTAAFLADKLSAIGREQQKAFSPTQRQQYVQLQRDLREAGMSYDALALDVEAVGDAAEEASDDFSGLGQSAKTAAFTISGAVKGLGDMLKPSGADRTEDFLKWIGADQATISAALDALYNEVGADEATRLRKRMDRGYKELTESFKESDAYREAHENLENAMEMTEKEFAKAAAALGKSPSQYMGELKQNVKDADKLLEHFSDTLEGAIRKTQGLKTEEQQAGSRITAHLGEIDRIQVAWDNARVAASYYYSGVLSAGGATPRPPGAPRGESPPVYGGAPYLGPGLDMPTMHRGGIVSRTGPAFLEKHETVLPAGVSPITVAPSITLNYSGAGGAGVASRMAHDVADQTTELIRVQLRRMA